MFNAKTFFIIIYKSKKLYFSAILLLSHLLLMKQMHILHIGGSLTQEVDTLFSIREKSCWKSSKVCFSRYIYQSQYEFQILLCLWKSKQHSLSFPRNRYLILKYFYSTKKIDTSAEWMKTLSCVLPYVCQNILR